MLAARSGSAASWGFAVGLNFPEGLEFVADDDNAPDTARYPCLFLIKNFEFSIF